MRDKIYIRILVLLMSIFSILGVINSFCPNGCAIRGGGVIVLSFIIMCGTFFITKIHLRSHIPLLIKIILIFGIYIIFSSAFNAANICEFAYSVRDNLYWIFSLILGFIISYQSDDKDRQYIIKGVLILVLPISLVIVFVKSGIIQPSYTVLDIAFILIPLLLFVFRIKNLPIKIILITFIGIAAILSFKRTTMLCFFTMVLIYYSFEIFLSKKRPRQLVALIIVCCVFCTSFFLIERLSGGFVSNRVTGLNNINTDASSKHRLIIYQNVWHKIITSTPTDLLFGHGYSASFKETGFFAHNDLLEVFLDYGLMGILIYLTFLILLTKYLFGFYKYRNMEGNESSVFFASYIAYLFFGMMNCLIVFPLYFAIFTFSFGLSIGKFEKIKIK